MFLKRTRENPLDPSHLWPIRKGIGMNNAEQHAALFAGRWIGETQGYDAPAHVWEIAHRGHYLTIETRWENQARGARLFGEALVGEPAFMLGEQKAMLVNSQHFVIRGWDTNDTRNGTGPNYDVVFSRPGIAELNAHAIWLKYNAEHPADLDAPSINEV